MKGYEKLFVHVFFVDIVSLSNRALGSTDDQVRKIEILFGYITKSSIFTKAKNPIVSHTGDGVAICFREHPSLPLDLAIYIHEKLRKYNQKAGKKNPIQIRIGINSGLIRPTKGVGVNSNYWCRGLINAQRIMSFGDSGHILLDMTTAKELIEASDKYKEIIHYLDQGIIKHGETIPVYSAYGKHFGNKKTPRSLLKSTHVKIESGHNIFESIPFTRKEILKQFQEFVSRKQRSQLQINRSMIKRKRKSK